MKLLVALGLFASVSAQAAIIDITSSSTVAGYDLNFSNGQGFSAEERGNLSDNVTVRFSNSYGDPGQFTNSLAVDAAVLNRRDDIIMRTFAGDFFDGFNEPDIPAASVNPYVYSNLDMTFEASDGDSRLGFFADGFPSSNRIVDVYLFDVTTDTVLFDKNLTFVGDGGFINLTSGHEYQLIASLDVTALKNETLDLSLFFDAEVVNVPVPGLTFLCAMSLLLIPRRKQIS